MKHAHFVILSVFALTTTGALQAQSSAKAIAEREIQRKQQLAQFASQSIQKGSQALAEKDYESAFSFYKSAVDALPSSGEATAQMRMEAIDGFAKSAVSLARQRISEGRFEDAKNTVAVVLERRYKPDDKAALELKNSLEDPDRFNRTMGPSFIATVEEVKQLLTEAQGFYDSGRFDLAFKRYEQVLNIDKYNIAARRGMERINKQRAVFAANSYNEARGEMLNQVNKAWELPVPRFQTQASTIIEQPQIDTRGTASINRKLDEIIIPRIEFRDATVREAVDFLTQRAAALDTTETDPTRRGLNVVIKFSPGSPEEGVQINLSLSQVPLRAALDYVARAANMKLKVEPFAVVIVPESEPTDVLITKEYKVPPGFITNLPAAGGAGGATAPPLAGGVSTVAPGSAPSIAERSGAREFLESQGVTFPPGASAIFLPSSSRLIVKNTQGNLDIIDALVDTLVAAPPTQVEIESKFLEVTQNNLEEMGFDWLLGQFALPFGTGIYGGGGTTPGGVELPGTITNPGTGAISGSSDWPILNPNNLPVGATSTSQGPITGANRSGTRAIQVNAVDALLFSTPIGTAPAIFSLAGVFTNPQFQVVLRALSQKKGVDLVSAPKVTTKSGQRATIEIIREFRYPGDYDLPQVTGSAGATFQPVIPTTPTSFETKNVGITLEVEPTVGPDNFSIDLILAPRVVEFEGFINYGSPIFASVAVVGATGLIPASTRTFLATENVINRPVFSQREVTTEVTVLDGQTVVLGGLLREDVQKVQDKVPILGDIPLAGRLFRTTADQHIKRNLIMFVTASLLDPAGQTIQKTETEDPDLTMTDSDGLSGDILPDDAMNIPLPQ